MLIKDRGHYGTAIGCAFAVLLNVGFAAAAEQIAVEGRTFTVFPENPSLFHPVVLQTEVDLCAAFGVDEVRVDNEDMSVVIDYSFGGVELDPCPPGTFFIRNIPVTGLQKTGTYRFDFFEFSVFQGSREVVVEGTGPVYWAETPAQGSLQSGIGIVRGWACDAESVEVRFDDLPRRAVAYGTSRSDTLEVCGDEDNGYGFVVGWGNLGLGPHRMRTYINGVEVADVEFEVVGLDEPFVRGLDATYQLENFPELGDSTTIQWSEPEQKFIIIEKAP